MRRSRSYRRLSGEVLVLATAATVQSHAYREACAAVGLRATEVACPLLVPLVEEGWIDHAVTREVLRIYLSEALTKVQPQAVLLGCTHYPLIAGEIEKTLRELGSDAVVIDSAEATARGGECGAWLRRWSRTLPNAATFECFATDSVEKFQRLGSLVSAAADRARASSRPGRLDCWQLNCGSYALSSEV